MCYKIILVAILICSTCNIYSTQKYSNTDDIEIYEPYYQKLLASNLPNNTFRTVNNVLRTNNLQSTYSGSQTSLQTSSLQSSQVSSSQVSNSSYMTNSSIQSSIDSSSQTSETNICNKTISIQNSKSNIYDVLDSNLCTSNNNSNFININPTNQAQSNDLYNRMYYHEQRNSNLIHVNINFNNNIIHDN